MGCGVQSNMEYTQTNEICHIVETEFASRVALSRIPWGGIKRQKLPPYRDIPKLLRSTQIHITTGMTRVLTVMCRRKIVQSFESFKHCIQD